MSKEKKKRASLLARLFLPRNRAEQEDVDIFMEEKVLSPGKTIIKNFIANKLAMGGLIIFLMIFLFVLLGPLYFKLDLSYEEGTQINVAPGMDMMKVPSALEGKVEDISVGSTFSVGVSKTGGLFVWGKPQILPSVNVSQFPKKVLGKKYKKVAAGYDHVVALTDKNKLVSWGNNRLKQTVIDPKVEADDGKIVQIAAGYQATAAVFDNGNAYAWGNKSVMDFKIKNKYKGKIKKVSFSSDALLGLTLDGEVVYLGMQDKAVSKIPEGLDKGVVDIATTSGTAAAVKEDGTVMVWGNISYKENEVPKTKSKIISIQGGRYHYTALTESGEVVSWGKNNFGQGKAPANLDKGVERIYSGYYQNYAIMKDGSIKTFGLKGYLLGTDELGRDVLNRIVNGGKMTMTMGAIAVIISTIIGVIIGGISGFFGGAVDLVLQRLTEMVSSIPFLPFAMILSSIVGGRLPEGARIFMIMVILGVLSWTGLSRLVRAQVLAEREQEFVTAARAMGIKEMTIVFKHIIPNVISVIIVTATLGFASSMLTESSLSFLGFGVTLPRPTWGNMLNNCINSVVIRSFWWRWVFPSLMLGICCICINLVGDGLRDAIDPKSNER